jgi:hypothetical protein
VKPSNSLSAPVSANGSGTVVNGTRAFRVGGPQLTRGPAASTVTRAQTRPRDTRGATTK